MRNKPQEDKSTQSYAYYTKMIMGMRQAKIRGEVIVAKPVLMLTLIEGIENGIFTNNRFTLNEWLEIRYQELMREYTKHSQFAKPADIANPFWYLTNDGFWHLQFKTDANTTAAPTRGWLKDNVRYGCFDYDLWVLLHNDEWRERLRHYIIEHKLPKDHY